MSLLNGYPTKTKSHDGDVLFAVGAVGLAHWLGNKKRKACGLPPEPMNKYAGMGVGFGLGYVFWWLPFAVYMLLDVAFFHLHLVAFLFTVALFVGAWKLYKRRYAKKYAPYYATRPVVMTCEPEPHTPASDEWLADAGKRMRKNVGLG